MREWVYAVLPVNDAEILAAIPPLVAWARVVPEPAAAAGLALLFSGRADLPAAGPVVVVISGGNIDLPRLAAYLTP